MNLKQMKRISRVHEEAIQEALAAEPGAWVCVMCEHVFGPEERAYDPVSTPAPDLVSLIGADQRLCGECFLGLSTTRPPNFPGGDPSGGPHRA